MGEPELKIQVHDQALVRVSTIAVEVARRGGGPFFRYLKATSPELAKAVGNTVPGEVSKKDAGAEDSPTDAMLAVRRYQLRLASRATPYGHLAAVGRAWPGKISRVGDPGSLSLSELPDVSGMEHKGVNRADVFYANDLVVFRGESVHNPLAPPASKAAGRRTASVKASTVLTRALRVSANGATVDELIAAIIDEANCSQEEAMQYLASLVNQEYIVSTSRTTALLGDWWSPWSTTDECMNDGSLPTSPAAVTRPEPKDETAYGFTGVRYQAVLKEPSVLSPALYNSARAFARTFPKLPTDPVKASAHLDEFGSRFVEAFGEEELVPILRAVDEVRGIGYPDGYSWPRDPKKEVKHRHEYKWPDRLTGQLFEAIEAHSAEIRLDDPNLLNRWRTEGELRAGVTDFDMCFRVLGESGTGIQAGNFDLVYLGSNYDARSYGARFFDTADDSTRLEIDEVAVQLYFAANFARAQNVIQVSPTTRYALGLGIAPVENGQTWLDVRQIRLGAINGRLLLWSDELGRQVRFTTPHLLNMAGMAPNIARLLAEISRPEQPAAWSWGEHQVLPYLPRVRLGRVVVERKSWRIPERLKTKGATMGEWRRLLDEWIDDAGVDEDVIVSHPESDSLELNVQLNDRIDRAVFKRELEGGRVDRLFESDKAIRNEPYGWTGGYVADAVFSGRFVQSGESNELSGASPKRSGEIPTSMYRPTSLDLAGRDPNWIYARMYVPASLQNQVLHRLRHLGSDLGPLPRSFFVRYRDADGDHLRIRWRNDKYHAPDATTLLEWGDILREEGLVSNLVLTGYFPESARYGHQMQLAHEVFCSSSEYLVEARLPRRAGSLDDSILTTARDIADILSVAIPKWQQWFVESYRHEANASRRVRELYKARPDYMYEPADRGARFSDLAESTREHLARVGEGSRTDVLKSLNHMHVNRAIGTDRGSENRVYGLIHAECRRVAFKSL